MSKQIDRAAKKRRLQITAGMGVAIVIVLLIPLLGLASAGAYGAHLENNDAFCAGCHTEPESTYVRRAQAVHSGEHAADLAGFHAGVDEPLACIECHSGAGVSGRIDALEIGARDLLAYTGGDFPQPAPLTHAIPDANCSKCHADVAQTRVFNNHFHVFLGRWQEIVGEEAATCVDCHSSHTQDGQAGAGFLNERRTVAQCKACHRVMGD